MMQQNCRPFTPRGQIVSAFSFSFLLWEGLIRVKFGTNRLWTLLILRKERSFFCAVGSFIFIKVAAVCCSCSRLPGSVVRLRWSIISAESYHFSSLKLTPASRSSVVCAELVLYRLPRASRKRQFHPSTLGETVGVQSWKWLLSLSGRYLEHVQPEKLSLEPIHVIIRCRDSFLSDMLVNFNLQVPCFCIQRQEHWRSSHAASAFTYAREVLWAE